MSGIFTGTALSPRKSLDGKIVGVVAPKQSLGEVNTWPWWILLVGVIVASAAFNTWAEGAETEQK